MKATRYFTEQVLRKRPYLSAELCTAVVASPLRMIVQDDGRLRLWGRITLPGETESRILRVITLADGETLHNAFLDRNFRLEVA